MLFYLADCIVNAVGWDGGFSYGTLDKGVRKIANRKGIENLVTPSSEKAREIGRKGGIESGKARKKKKALKETMAMLLELPVYNTKAFDKMSEFGIDIEDIDNNTRLMYTLLQKAFTGDVAAIKEVRNVIGEDVNGEAIGKLDELLQGLKHAADEKTE